MRCAASAGASMAQRLPGHARRCQQHDDGDVTMIEATCSARGGGHMGGSDASVSVSVSHRHSHDHAHR